MAKTVYKTKHADPSRALLSSTGRFPSAAWESAVGNDCKLLKRNLLTVNLLVFAILFLTRKHGSACEKRNKLLSDAC